MIWLGDFNRHHPGWDEEQNNHLFTRANLDEAQVLIDAASSYDLVMALPKGILTLAAMAMGKLTITDNVFMSFELQQNLTRWVTVPEDWLAKSNHFPINTTIEVVTKRMAPELKYNY